MDKTFLLGVGCQKGGTTWLHSYLEGHPACNMGTIKEYHFFDVLDLGDAVPFRTRFRQQFEEATQRLDEVDPARFRLRARLMAQRDEAQMRLEFYERPAAYAEYFTALAQDPETALVGDITPNYALLSDDMFRTIRDTMEGLGFRVKVVFLMRDPLDRFYSSIRMRLRKKTTGADSTRTLERMYRTCMNEGLYMDRSRYEITLDRLDRCFDAENVFLGFFEEFFTASEVARLAAFLGLGFIPPDFGVGKVTHAKSLPIPPELAAETRRRLAPTYDDCGARFGTEYISSLWPSAAL